MGGLGEVAVPPSPNNIQATPSIIVQIKTARGGARSLLTPCLI